MKMPGPVALVMVSGALFAGSGRAAEAGFRWHEGNHIEREAHEIDCLEGSLAGTVVIELVPGSEDIQCNLPPTDAPENTQTTSTSLIPHTETAGPETSLPSLTVHTSRDNMSRMLVRLQTQKGLDERSKDRWGNLLNNAVTFGPFAMWTLFRLGKRGWRRAGQIDPGVPAALDEAV